MAEYIKDYSIFYEFIKKFMPNGFKEVNENDPVFLELNELLEANNQFFYIADIIQLKILWTSRQSKKIIGIEPEDVSPYFFMEATHPDDIQRLNLGKTRLIKLSQDIFIAGEGKALLSTNFNVRNATGGYTNLFMQNYLFYTEVPYKTVFYLKIHTDIDWCKKIKNGFHYYLGNDITYFRYPDEKLLSLSSVFTLREFEIIKLIESGMSTKKISEKLFLSPYTVNTHRANILKKSAHNKISDLISELVEKGIL
jgi:DNA-binding CsgD family transcriptional regulator